MFNYVIQAVAVDNKFKFIYLTWELTQCDQSLARHQARIMQCLYPDCYIYVFKVPEFSYNNGVVLNGEQIAVYQFNEEIPFAIDYNVPVNPPTCHNEEKDKTWIKEHNLWSVNLYPGGSSSNTALVSAFIDGRLANMFAEDMSASTNGVATICRNSHPRRTYHCGVIISDIQEASVTNPLEAEIWIDML